MSNESETKMPEKVYVLAALLGIMTKDPKKGIGVDAFVAKYSVTPEERRQIATAALREKIAGSIDDSLATVRRSVDKFILDEGLSRDDVREAALAIVRGAFRNPDVRGSIDDLVSIAHAVGFLCGKGELIEVDGPYWSDTGTSEYAEHLAWIFGSNSTIAGDLAMCEYDEANHGHHMVDAPPELWQLMQDIGAWEPKHNK